MTAEQIATLADAAGDPLCADKLRDALHAAIALAEQTCETCALTDFNPTKYGPSCLSLGRACALMGNRCGAWTAKEKR